MTLRFRRHSRLSGDDLHKLTRWTVADTAGRLGLSPGVEDDGKLCHQTDNDSYWILSDYSVPTWTELSSAGVAAVTSVAGRTGDVTLSSADLSDVGTAANEDVGVAVGDVPQLEDIGGGTPGLPAVDGSKLTGVAGGGSAITVTDEGGPPLTTDASSFDFVGAVTASAVGDDVTITVTPGSAPVASVFGRLDAVTADASDYDASQIDNDSLVTGAFVDDALNQLNTDVTGAQADATQALADAAAAQADATSAKTKTDRITISQAVNLDTVEADTATNNAKVSYTDAATVAANAAHAAGDGSDHALVAALGTAANEDVGATIGDVVQLENVGGNPGLPAVDGSQLTGITGGGGSDISVEDEGIELTAAVTKFNFVGAGVTVTEPVANEMQVTVAGGAAPVDSVFGRTGPVLAVSGDYDSSEVDNASTVAGGTGSVTTALEQLASDIAAKTVDVVSNVATNTILGRDTAGSGNSEELTPAEVRTLINVEDGATADQTGAEIKAAYEGELDTNAFTDAEQTKLAGIEASATADQTAGEIEAIVNHDNLLGYVAAEHFTEASIDHTAITNVGSNTHAQIDTHLANAAIHNTITVAASAPLSPAYGDVWIETP